MRILVYGAGALGSALGGMLALAGQEVTLLGRPTLMAAINQQGLAIDGLWGTHKVTGLRGITSLKPNSEFDLILVTVKSFDTAAAAADIAQNVASGLVLSLQNGYGNYAQLVAALGSKRVLAGRVIIGFRLNAPGSVTVTVVGDKIALGCPSEDVAPAKIQAIVELFNQANIPAFYTEKIDAYLWAKIFYNCALNPLSAILQLSYGQLGEYPTSRELIDQVLAEIFAVTQKAGIELFWSDLTAVKKAFWETMLPPTASHNSSMYQDLLRGKRLEIDALNGAVVMLGREYDVAVPVNETLVRLIKVLEAKNFKAG